MASKEQQTPSPAAVLGAVPPNIEEHTKDMERRQAQMDADHQRILECLDPTEAKRHEDRKTLYEWNVEAKLFRPAKGNQHAHRETIKKDVVAHNPQDAWAMFCDSIGEWPSYRDTKPTITKGQKRTLRSDD